MSNLAMIVEGVHILAIYGTSRGVQILGVVMIKNCIRGLKTAISLYVGLENVHNIYVYLIYFDLIWEIGENLLSPMFSTEPQRQFENGKNAAPYNACYPLTFIGEQRVPKVMKSKGRVIPIIHSVY